MKLLFDLLEDILTTENEADFLVKVKALWEDRKKLQDAFADYSKHIKMTEQSLRFTEAQFKWLTEENEDMKKKIEAIKEDRDAISKTNKELESKLES